MTDRQMNTIEHCLSLVPLPYLALAFSVFRTIWTEVQEVQASKEQMRVLAQSTAQLLHTLDKQYRGGKLIPGNSQDALKQLNSLLEEISSFVEKQKSYGFFKLLLVKEERQATIGSYHKRIGIAVNAFQIAALVDIQHWQQSNDKARISDQRTLHEHLHRLEENQRLLIQALDPGQHPIAIMTTLRRCIDEQRGDREELRFFSHSLRYLTTTSGQQVDLRPWTVTSFDIQFGPLIGRGGFGKVYRGKWNQVDVALKVMKNTENIVPRSASIKREVETWSNLRHPHILQFLGANILDDEPFIVMPYMKHGNLRDYIDNHPDCNRLKLTHDIALGLTYLHSQNVIHGDIKAVNVLVDDGPRALLCDFGLSRIKADVSSRTTAAKSSTIILGTQNWMAPELFEGRSLRMACDLYSFGMTIYEVFTNETPLGSALPARLADLVVKEKLRPSRPKKGDAPQLTDAVWKLAQECWANEPSDRPTAAVSCKRIGALLETSNYVPLLKTPETFPSKALSMGQDTSGTPPWENRQLHLQNIAKTTMEALHDRCIKVEYQADPNSKSLWHITRYGIKHNVASTQQNTRVYLDDAPELKEWRATQPAIISPIDALLHLPVTIELRLETTVMGAQRHYTENPLTRIGILNFASRRIAGGGFAYGNEGQEESLARSSSLYASLSTEVTRKYYTSSPEGDNNGYSTHAMIYSPNVVLFRDDDGKWFKPILVDVISTPAVNAGQVRASSQRPKDEVEGEIQKVMKERMARILAAFERASVRNLVLGAFGTGFCENDVKTIAEIWRELLYGLNRRFTMSFERVIFAIPDRDTLEKFASVFFPRSPSMHKTVPLPDTA